MYSLHQSANWVTVNFTITSWHQISFKQFLFTDMSYSQLASSPLKWWGRRWVSYLWTRKPMLMHWIDPYKGKKHWLEVPLLRLRLMAIPQTRPRKPLLHKNWNVECGMWNVASNKLSNTQYEFDKIRLRNGWYIYYTEFPGCFLPDGSSTSNNSLKRKKRSGSFRGVMGMGLI